MIKDFFKDLIFVLCAVAIVFSIGATVLFGSAILSLIGTAITVGIVIVFVAIALKELSQEDEKKQ